MLRFLLRLIEGLIAFIKQIELHLKKRVRTIRSDNGTEFKNQTIHSYLKEKGITHNFSAPYTPQQNGVVERRNRSLCEAARTMLDCVNLLMYFWAEAVATACITQNQSYIHRRFNITPYEKSDTLFPHSSIFPEHPTEFIPLDSFNLDFFFLFDSPDHAIDAEGYTKDNNIPEINKLTDDHPTTEQSINKHSSVEGESETPKQKDPSVEGEYDTSNPKDPLVEKETTPSSTSNPKEAHSSEQPSPSAVQTTTIEGESSDKPASVEGESSDKPASAEGKSSDNQASVESEQPTPNTLPEENQPTSDYPSDTEAVHGETLPGYDPAYPPLEKWTKDHPKTQVICNPDEKEGIDYDETFAPIVRLESIRIFLAFAAHKNFDVYQMDVKCAFLNGELEETVYVEQPPGFINEKYPNHCYILDKAVYGLKQAPRAWYETLTRFLKQSNFKDDPELSKDFETLMKSKFQISMTGKINFFLGLQVKQTSEDIFINQEKYTRSLLEKFGMENCSNAKVPMVAGTRLTPSLDKPAVDQKVYKSMIGSLLYLTASCPDIMFLVCNCARYQENPREPHLAAVKTIFRYLHRTPSLGLWYPANSGFFLQAYSDADLGGCALDRKSTSGGCQFLDGKLISWQSKKQTCVSMPTAEAEYIAAAACTSQMICVQSQLRDYAIHMRRIPLFCDSQSAIRISHNPVQHSKTKHISLR
ncbi:hypothetical protein L1887_32314 [Cichorium endivia]|nr:hypothetical protein L1887_32314 [Cichorium endivia]